MKNFSEWLMSEEGESLLKARGEMRLNHPFTDYILLKKAYEAGMCEAIKDAPQPTV